MIVKTFHFNPLISRYNFGRQFASSSAAKSHSVPTSSKSKQKQQQQQSRVKAPPTVTQMRAISVKEFALSYQDFLPSQVWSRRDPLFEKLVHADMLERRLMIDIPEFYVGSILSVTLSDPNLGQRQNRFVGICIRREKEGLHHNFTLRNVIDGLGVEVMFELYNPTILKIETLLLEKRLDEDLGYLVDALPEYSTFSFNMESTNHPIGKPVPVNPLKVKLKPPPWTRPWFLYDLEGIEDAWTQSTPWFKRKFIQNKDLMGIKRYDIVRHYREAAQELEHDLGVQKRMLEFEKERRRGRSGRKGENEENEKEAVGAGKQKMQQVLAKKPLLRSIAGEMREIFLNVSSIGGKVENDEKSEEGK